MRSLISRGPLLAGLSAAALGLVMTASPAARAATIGLGITGGPGLDQGALCATTTGVACPTDPTYSLTTAGAAVGSFAIDTSTDTATFTLTLAQNVVFGAETLLAGSTFSGTGIAVSASALTKTVEQYTQTGSPLNGTATLSFSPTLALIEATPAISALSCTVGLKVDTCAVSLGGGGLEVGPGTGGTDYSTFLTFNVNAIPVPLPATAWLLMAGIGCYAFAGRRSNKSPAVA